MSSEEQEQVGQLKEKGNKCVKDHYYPEALLHYTDAIKLDGDNAILYSNRSFAFLKLDQYYLAHDDAKQVIRLEPNWPKGYFRKAEAEFQAENYEEALLSYQMGYVYSPDDQTLKDSITKARIKKTEQAEKERWLPWKGVFAGVILGLIIVIGDQASSKPTLGIFLTLIFIPAVGATGYAAMWWYRGIQISQRYSLLKKPPDLIEEWRKEGKQKDSTSTTTEKKTTSHKRGGPGPGRQRYRQGKT